MTPARWTVLAASAAAAGLAALTAVAPGHGVAGLRPARRRHSPISRARRAPCSRCEQVLQGARAGQAGPGSPPGGSRRKRSAVPTRPLPEVAVDPLPAAAPAADASDGVDEHLVSLVTPAAFEAEQYRALRHIVEQLHRTANAPGRGGVEPSPRRRQDHDRRQPGGGTCPGSRGARPPDRRRSSAAHARPSPRYRRHRRRKILSAPSSTRGCPSSGSRIRGRRSTCPSSAPGQPPPSPYEVLKSPRLGELIEDARRRYDYIVLDTPPLTPNQDCRVIGRWVDGFLFVVAAHRTPRRLVEEALTALDHTKVLGIVFNEDDRSISAYRSGYYADHYSPRRASAAGGPRGVLTRVAKRVGASLRRDQDSSRPGREPGTHRSRR